MKISHNHCICIPLCALGDLGGSMPFPKPAYTRRAVLYLAVLLLTCFTAPLQAAQGPTTRQWTIDGVTRQALVYVPDSATTELTPLIFAFHGHSGTMQKFARLAFEKAWPQAIVVYPQGLPTPGRLTDHEGKFSGWEALPGDQNDRDLKFFDAMLESLKKDYKIDPARIYATGHSNGGSFTYVLWRARGDEFTAFAPASTAFPAFLNHPDAPPITAAEIPKVALRPVLHMAGKNDPLVKFAWQEHTFDAVRKINQCTDAAPDPWSENCTLYPSPAGAPVVTCIHPGGHELPPHARDLIVKFFKQFPAATTQP